MTKIGEVIESSSTGYTAECYELYGLPALGTLVKTADALVEIYGIVCHSTTASIEPGRRPIARGKNEETEEAIYSQSPQLSKLLRSEFQVLTVGHRVEGRVYQYLPPRPARIHAFVYPCNTAEILEFSQSLDFLNLLVDGNSQIPAEEVVAATLRQMSHEQEDPDLFLVAAGKHLTSLMTGDYNRLRTILGRMRP